MSVIARPEGEADFAIKGNPPLLYFRYCFDSQSCCWVCLIGVHFVHETLRNNFPSENLGSHMRYFAALNQQQQLRAELPNSFFATPPHPKQLELSLRVARLVTAKNPEWSREKVS